MPGEWRATLSKIEMLGLLHPVTALGPRCSPHLPSVCPALKLTLCKALSQALCKYLFIYSLQQTWELGTVISPALRMGKLRPGKTK